MKTVLTVHKLITRQGYTPTPYISDAILVFCALKHASICRQVHADTSVSKKPLTECDPIQLAIFSHRLITITHGSCLASR